MGFAIDLHHRPESAAAEAVDRFEAELQIQIRFAGPDSGQILDRVENASRTTDMTGGTHADMHLMAALGNKTEGLIEGGDVLYPGYRNLKPLADPFQCFLGKPIALALNFQQHLNERTGFALMFVDNLINSFSIHAGFPILFCLLRLFGPSGPFSLYAASNIAFDL